MFKMICSVNYYARFTFRFPDFSEKLNISLKIISSLKIFLSFKCEIVNLRLCEILKIGST